MTIRIAINGFGRIGRNVVPLRPIRPKPLIAMRMVIDLLQGCPCDEVADRVIQEIYDHSHRD
jgi:glyceraldehyde-3-phosphate dehydrogenase/erythrose-4-phosphate dehydrogenase